MINLKLDVRGNAAVDEYKIMTANNISKFKPYGKRTTSPGPGCGVEQLQTQYPMDVRNRCLEQR